MAIYGRADHNQLVSRVVTKKYTHLGIEPVFWEIFDEVGRRLETRTMPRHTRSGFVNKAARLWVNAVKEDSPELKPVIEEIEQRHAAKAATKQRGKVLRLKAGGD